MYLKYFKPAEFLECQPMCFQSDMDDDFLVQLDYARELAGVPFVLNSAYRSVEYEKQKGRNGSSSHCKGVAVDLYCISSTLRFRIVSGLIGAGFERIGIAPNFIHVDSDADKPNCIWLY